MKPTVMNTAPTVDQYAKSCYYSVQAVTNPIGTDPATAWSALSAGAKKPYQDAIRAAIAAPGGRFTHGFDDPTSPYLTFFAKAIVRTALEAAMPLPQG